MDDTAFHYSRTLRIIMVLSILLPIIGICSLLWYFYADGTGDSATAAEDQTPVEEEATNEDSTKVGNVIQADWEHPLQPPVPMACTGLCFLLVTLTRPCAQLTSGKHLSPRELTLAYEHE